MANDIIPVTVNIPDLGADNRQFYAVKAPLDANGGGLTLLEAYAVPSTTVTNSLGVGGTTFTLALHRYSSAGTPAVNGTIAAAVGGTAQGWTAGVRRDFTIDEDYAFIDAGEYVVVQYNEINAGNPVACQVHLLFAQGKQ